MNLFSIVAEWMWRGVRDRRRRLRQHQPGQPRVLAECVPRVARPTVRGARHPAHPPRRGTARQLRLLIPRGCMPRSAARAAQAVLFRLPVPAVR